MGSRRSGPMLGRVARCDELLLHAAPLLYSGHVLIVLWAAWGAEPDLPLPAEQGADSDLAV